MSKKAARFTEADIRRVIRAVSKECAPMAVEIDQSGTIRLVPYEAPADARRRPQARIEPEREIVL